MTRLTVSPIFSDGMILQRNVAAPIWGTAPDGETVAIRFARKVIKVTAKDGHWQTHLPVVTSSGPYSLEISCGEVRLTIKNILAGEVWIAGGQSNMEWPLKHSRGGLQTIEEADHGQIRFYNIQKVRYPGMMDDTPAAFARESAWRPATSKHVGEFSAVGYYFALDLHQKLVVPIGIIECNLGGSSASAWISRDFLTRDPDLRACLDEYDQSVANLDRVKYLQASQMLLQFAAVKDQMPVDPDCEIEKPTFDLASLSPEAAEALQMIMAPGPRGLFGYPGSLYENMLLSFAPFACQGVIFYQGESDVAKARLYARTLERLIACWRDAFTNPQLKFLIVQLAAFGNDGYPEGDIYAILRDQQQASSEKVSDTYLTTAFDVGHRVDIHPRSKSPVGKRLALLAWEKVYGEDIDSSGPVYQSMQVSGSEIILEFDHAGYGLVSLDEELKGFSICSANRHYYPAIAKITGRSTIALSSVQVPLPAAARYGWANFMEVNVYNSEGLPMMPFKTDKYL